MNDFAAELGKIIFADEIDGSIDQDGNLVGSFVGAFEDDVSWCVISLINFQCHIDDS
jgi:hypothetical protein